MTKIKILVLAGSGEFTVAMEETDAFLLDTVKKNLDKKNKKIKIAIIPTAAGKESDYKKWINAGIKHFSKLGAEAIGFEVINNKDANNIRVAEKIKEFQLVYFSGGDPGHLFQSLKGSVFWNNIYENYKSGAIIAGSSAGAMILGNYVISNVYQTFEDNKKPVWEKAFDFVPFAIIPHFDYIFKKEKKKYLKMIAQTPAHIKKNILGIDEDTSLILDFEKGHFEIKGKGSITLIKKGVKQIFNDRSKFPIKILIKN